MCYIIPQRVKKGPRNSLISQILFVPSNKCKRTNTKFEKGAIIALVLQKHKSVI